MLHTSIQGSGEHPAFPAQWLYGLCRDLPGDEFLVDSVAAVQLSPTRQLDTCNGCQDHTVLPYARSTPSSDVSPAYTAARPTSVTTADALLSRTGWRQMRTDL